MTAEVISSIFFVSGINTVSEQEPSRRQSLCHNSEPTGPLLNLTIRSAASNKYRGSVSSLWIVGFRSIL